MGDLLGAGADERERRRDLVAQRLECAQQDRQALAFDRLTDEEDPQLRLRGMGCCVRGFLARRRVRGQAGVREIALDARVGPAGSVVEVDAVGDDAVAPAVEAPSGPGGGLGDGDAHVQAVHPAAPAERDGGDPVGENVLGVGVEGAHERQLAGAAESVPGEEGHDGLVDVQDVVAAVAQLAAQGEDGGWRERHVRDGAVGGQRRRCARARRRPPRRSAAAGARRGAAAARARRRGRYGARMRGSWPAAASSHASASTWRVTPPG